MIIVCGLRAWGLYKDQSVLRNTGKAMMHLVGLQIILGFASFIIVPHEVREAGETISTLEVAVTTAHQAMGAILLALSFKYAVVLRKFIKAS